MKNIRKAIPAVALLLALNGCALKNEVTPTETENPTLVTAAQEIESVAETVVIETEGTVPVRESDHETESASEQTATEPPATEPEQKSEGRKPSPTEPPAENLPKTEPAETQPPVTEPPKEEPSVTEPEREAATTEPPVMEPPETEPPATEPEVTEPAPTQPPEMTPVETEPPETAPPATEAPETEPPKGEINTGELESYGRRYATSTYGYNGNPNCNPSTNAGYFPGVRVKVTTMEEGYAAAREAVDYQYSCDVAMGRAISAEIDGVTVRRNINVCFEPTDDPQVFVVWCYYGGEA